MINFLQRIDLKNDAIVACKRDPLVPLPRSFTSKIKKNNTNTTRGPTSDMFLIYVFPDTL